MTRVLLTTLLVLIVTFASPTAEARARETLSGPLEDYVAKPDNSYHWVEKASGSVLRAKYTELILTSQTWRKTKWKHQLFLIKPSTVTAQATHGLLVIAGGGWRKGLETDETRLPGEATMFAALAERLATPVAVLLHVPHQPLFENMYEDEIIAYTFEQFMRSGDAEWPLLLPMVKSAVRGMDAAQEFARQRWSLELKTFTVTGASKRGWTTWLTGAVDSRATCIAPMVIDMLNMVPQMKHQKEVWGAPSYMIHDYTDRGLDEQLDTPPGRALQAVVDPYHYRRRLTQPKLIILGTNDHYWPLDALNLYWDDLAGDKYILYVPNNRHGLEDYGRVLGSVHALHQHKATGMQLPKLTWQFKDQPDGVRLTLSSDQPTDKVAAWVATSDTRDFRGARWNSFATTRSGDGNVYDLPLPDMGFAAVFGEAVYGGATPYYFSTNVKIVEASSH